MSHAIKKHMPLKPKVITHQSHMLSARGPVEMNKTPNCTAQYGHTYQRKRLVMLILACIQLNC